MTLGAVSVPVDPHHPEARRLAMLREANVALVIGDPSDSGLQWAASEFTTVDLVCTDLNKVPSHPADYQNAVTPEADAFVEFTSGSTGKPKGIVQTHQGIVTIGKALAHGLRVTASARVAQIAPYIFDVAMMEFAMSFIAAWVYYGANGFERDISFAFSNASYHTDLIDKSPDFRLISSNPPSCLQVCFYSTPEGILSDSSAENSKCTKEIVKRMVNRGFMFDFAPGREGHLFRVVINCLTYGGGTI